MISEADFYGRSRVRLSLNVNTQFVPRIRFYYYEEFAVFLEHRLPNARLMRPGDAIYFARKATGGSATIVTKLSGNFVVSVGPNTPGFASGAIITLVDNATQDGVWRAIPCESLGVIST